MPKNPFGSSAKPGYLSDQDRIKGADQLSYDRIKGALGNIKDPTSYTAGQSSMGFGNKSLTTPFNAFQYKTPTYKPFQFSTPESLNEKENVFGRAMNNMQRGLLRQQNAGLDSMKRTAQLTGTYSPAMMKNAMINSQNQTQEAFGDFGTKGALDLATERAMAEQAVQQNQSAENKYLPEQELNIQKMQAGENQAARGLDLDAASRAIAGEQVGLQADTASKDYFTKLLSTLFQNQIDPYAGQKGATPAKQGWLPALIDSASKVAGTVAPFFGGPAGIAMGGAKIAGALCLPKGTQIQTEDGSMNVEDVKVGDKVIGGEVIKTHSQIRPATHVFFNHIFPTGNVIMSFGHPYYDELLNITKAVHDSEKTYDILTTDGYYMVNGVKLGSTIEQ